MLFDACCLQVVMLAGLGRVQNKCNDGGMNPQKSAFQDLEEGVRQGRAYVRDGHLIAFGLPWNDVPGDDGTGDGGRDDRCGACVHNMD